MTRPFEEDLTLYLKSGYQALYVQTSEEQRLETSISAVAQRLKYKLYTWDIADGFQRLMPDRNGTLGPDLTDRMHGKCSMAAFKAVAAITATAESQKSLNEKEKCFFTDDCLFVFRDVDDYFVDHQVRRYLRNALEARKLVLTGQAVRQMIIASPTLNMHPKLKSSLTVLDFSLPDEEQLGHMVDFVQRSLESSNKCTITLSTELREQLIGAARGLTHTEAENALSLAVITHKTVIAEQKTFTADMVATLLTQKAATIKKSEVLTFIPYEHMTPVSQIGGYENLFRFIQLRKKAYTKEAREAHLDLPKGVVLLGAPGTGKSVVAMSIAQQLGLPGYLMDVGSVFGSLVGESESRMRSALKQVEAQHGCVLVLDEADKALGNAHESQGDSGVTRRVFGQLLSWMANKNDRTFVVMTMNRIKGIPPEMLRAGRFDAVFYVDLPNAVERRNIMEIHFRKRHVDPAGFGFAKEDWDDLINQTVDYSGSELEDVVKESMAQAFSARDTTIPEFEELRQAIATVRPLALLDPEGLAAIREQGEKRARPVGLTTVAAPAPGDNLRTLRVGNN